MTVRVPDSLRVTDGQTAKEAVCASVTGSLATVRMGPPRTKPYVCPRTTRDDSVEFRNGFAPTAHAGRTREYTGLDHAEHLIAMMEGLTRC